MKTRTAIEADAGTRICAFLLLGVLGFGGACQLIMGARWIHFHGDITHPESVAVQQAEWALESGRIYAPVDSPPYTPAPYGPAWYLGLMALAKATGAGFEALLHAGRMVVLGCFAGIALLAYAWCRRAGYTGWACAFGALLILAELDFSRWNVSVRPDVPALLLTLSAIVVLCWREAPGWRALVVAGLLLGLAGTVKQSFVSAPIAITLWLGSQRRWRELGVLVGAAVGLAAAMVGLLALRGENAIAAMLLIGSSARDLRSALGFFKTDLLGFPFQLALLGLAAAGWTASLRSSDSRLALLRFYFAVAWIFSILTLAQLGGDANYLLEPWTVCALLAPFGLLRILDWKRPPILRLAALIAVVGLIATAGVRWADKVQSPPPPGMAPVAAMLRGHTVLSDNSYLAAQGSAPELLDPFLNYNLEIAGRWSPAPIVSSLGTHKYEMVAIGIAHGRVATWRGLTVFSPTILRAIQTNYVPLCETKEIAIYVPRGSKIPSDNWQASGCVAPTSAPVL